MKAKNASVKKTESSDSAPQAHEKVESDWAAGTHATPCEQLIAEAAYFRAEQRGFVPGYELCDWLDAEADVKRKR